MEPIDMPPPMSEMRDMSMDEKPMVSPMGMEPMGMGTMGISPKEEETLVAPAPVKPRRRRRRKRRAPRKRRRKQDAVAQR